MKNNSKIHWSLLLFFAGIWVYIAVNFQRSAAPGAIFNELQLCFNATASEIVQIGAIFMWVYALVQLVVGTLTDRYGGARVIAVGGTMLMAGALFFPFCTTLPQVYISRILVGAGCGAIFISMMKEIDRLFPHSFPRMLGILYIFGFLGTIMGTLPVSWLTGYIGWRHTFLIAGVLGLAGLIAYFVCMSKTRLPQIRQEPFRPGPIFKPLMRKTTLPLILSGSLVNALYYLMISVLGKKLMEDCGGLTSAQAGIVLMAMAITSAVTSYLVGKICSDWIRRRLPVLRSVMFTGILGTVPIFLCLLLQIRAPWIFVISLLFLAAGSGNGAVTTGMLRELTPHREIGTAGGTSNFTSFVCIGLFSSLAGFLMDFLGGSNVIHTETAVIYPRISYIGLYVLMLTGALGAFVCSFLVPETNGRNISSENQ